MRNFFNLVLLSSFCGHFANAETAKTNLPLAEISNYVAKIEKADPYETKRLFIKKDPSFKNGIVLVNVSHNCGQGLCTNYVFVKNSSGNFDFAGIINGIFEESKESKTTPDYPDVWTQTKSGKESQMLKWSYNAKTQVYENK